VGVTSALNTNGVPVLPLVPLRRRGDFAVHASNPDPVSDPRGCSAEAMQVRVPSSAGAVFQNLPLAATEVAARLRYRRQAVRASVAMFLRPKPGASCAFPPRD
jgi:hypothetical protein